MKRRKFLEDIFKKMHIDCKKQIYLFFKIYFEGLLVSSGYKTKGSEGIIKM